MRSGVYAITDPKGRVYIGSAVNFGSRWRIHRYHLRHASHHNAKLQAIARKHGVDSLRFSKILVCRREDLILFEQLCIDLLRPGLNIARHAGSTLGYRHTEATKERFKSRRRSRGNAGRTHSHETRLRISLAKRAQGTKPTGRAVSSSTRQRIRNALLGRKAGPMSAEHKAKISAANKGRKPSQKAVQASAAARRGRKVSPEATAKRVASYMATCRRRKQASGENGF